MTMIRELDKHEVEIYWARFHIDHIHYPIHSFHSGWYKKKIYVFDEPPTTGWENMWLDVPEFQELMEWAKRDQRSEQV